MCDGASIRTYRSDQGHTWSHSGMRGASREIEMRRDDWHAASITLWANDANCKGTKPQLFTFPHLSPHHMCHHGFHCSAHPRSLVSLHKHLNASYTFQLSPRSAPIFFNYIFPSFSLVVVVVVEYQSSPLVSISIYPLAAASCCWISVFCCIGLLE